MINQPKELKSQNNTHTLSYKKETDSVFQKMFSLVHLQEETISPFCCAPVVISQKWRNVLGGASQMANTWQFVVIGKGYAQHLLP